MPGNKLNWVRSNRQRRLAQDLQHSGAYNPSNPLVFRRSQAPLAKDDAPNARKLLFAGARVPNKRRKPSLPEITMPEVIF